jgi:hypothetical protein
MPVISTRSPVCNWQRVNNARQAVKMADDATKRGDAAKAAEYTRAAEAIANQLVTLEVQVEELKGTHYSATQAADQAKAAYAAGEKRVDLTVTDLGGLGGMASMASWANVTSDKETATEVEKTYKAGNRTVMEKQQKDGSRGEYTVLLANGVVVESRGEKVDVAALKGIVDGMDLGKVEALKRAAK